MTDDSHGACKESSQQSWVVFESDNMANFTIIIIRAVNCGFKIIYTYIIKSMAQGCSNNIR